MRTELIGIVSFLLAAILPASADAWAHAGRWGTASGGGGSWSAHGWRGGSASGGGGSWSGEGWRGGTASGGDGSWKAKGAYGGKASGGDGSWSATNRYGSTVYGGYHPYYGYHPPYGAYHPYYYHPPTTVNYYGNSCGDCGGWSTAGAVAAGAVVGAAVASARTSNSYAAGYAAGAADSYPMGSIYSTLPAGSRSVTTDGTTYYVNGSAWFKPSFGANGVYYRVVPTP